MRSTRTLRTSRSGKRWSATASTPMRWPIVTWTTRSTLSGADYIDSDDEGARDIGIPTCARNFLAEPATDLDREVYQAMVDEGMLQADVTGVDISLYNYYSDNVPLIDFECGFMWSDGVISRTINPIEPGDTPKMPMFVWEAVVAKTREAVRRLNELMAAGE